MRKLVMGVGDDEVWVLQMATCWALEELHELLSRDKTIAADVAAIKMKPPFFEGRAAALKETAPKKPQGCRPELHSRNA